MYISLAESRSADGFEYAVGYGQVKRINCPNVFFDLFLVGEERAYGFTTNRPPVLPDLILKNYLLQSHKQLVSVAALSRPPFRSSLYSLSPRGFRFRPAHQPEWFCATRHNRSGPPTHSLMGWQGEHLRQLTIGERTNQGSVVHSI
jgi:hypothetical protein